MAHALERRLRAAAHRRVLPDHRERRAALLEFVLREHPEVEPRGKAAPGLDALRGLQQELVAQAVVVPDRKRRLRRAAVDRRLEDQHRQLVVGGTAVFVHAAQHHVLEEVPRAEPLPRKRRDVLDLRHLDAKRLEKFEDLVVRYPARIDVASIVRIHVPVEASGGIPEVRALDVPREVDEPEGLNRLAEVARGLRRDALAPLRDREKLRLARFVAFARRQVARGGRIVPRPRDRRFEHADARAPEVDLLGRRPVRDGRFRDLRAGPGDDAVQAFGQRRLEVEDETPLGGRVVRRGVEHGLPAVLDIRRLRVDALPERVADILHALSAEVLRAAFERLAVLVRQQELAAEERIAALARDLAPRADPAAGSQFRDAVLRLLLLVPQLSQDVTAGVVAIGDRAADVPRLAAHEGLAVADGGREVFERPRVALGAALERVHAVRPPVRVRVVPDVLHVDVERLGKIPVPHEPNVRRRRGPRDLARDGNVDLSVHFQTPPLRNREKHCEETVVSDNNATARSVSCQRKKTGGRPRERSPPSL